MKMFYKANGVCFLAGIVLIGAGIVIQTLEISGFTYISEKDKDLVTDKQEIELPDNNAKIFEFDFSPEFELVKDEGLTGNNAVLEVEHSDKVDVDAQLSFDKRCWLYNIYTDSYSKYCVNGVSLGYGFSGHDSEFDMFKEALAYFKKGIIYDNSYYYDPKITLRVSAEGYERFEELPDEYELITYGEYTDRTMEAEAAEEYQ